MNDPIGDRCLDEIERLHRFFERWLGDAMTDPAEFDRVEPVWPSDFTLITPDGTVLDRAAVTSWLRQARGMHADATALFRIEIRNAAMRLALPGGFRLCTYDEWQSVRGVESLRRSTALLEAREDVVLWRHLQETWVGPESVTG